MGIHLVEQTWQSLLTPKNQEGQRKVVWPGIHLVEKRWQILIKPTDQKGQGKVVWPASTELEEKGDALPEVYGYQADMNSSALWVKMTFSLPVLKGCADEAAANFSPR